jgi:hypothetical protein
MVSNRMVAIGFHSGSTALGTDWGAGTTTGKGLGGVAVRTDPPVPITRVTRAADGGIVSNRIVAFTSGSGAGLVKRGSWFLGSDMFSGLVLQKLSCARFYAGPLL